MLRSVIFAILLGVSGVGVLVSLGVWQVHRLTWKEAIIAQAETMMAEAPIALPATPDPVKDRYRAVRATGRFTGDEAQVLTSIQGEGPGFLVIAKFITAEGRSIMVDRGYVPETEKTTPRPAHDAEVVGNLNWPDDVTSSTPPYDADRAIWYGRDVAGISTQLGTEPLLIIARDPTGDGTEVQPVTTAGFRNDHFGYAVTWFSLAAAWAGMTVYLLWRIRARTV